MTTPTHHWYLIAYDIRDERRLKRLHYYLRKRATAVQKSVFAINTDAAGLAAVERGLRARADPKVDDQRLYAIPGPAALWVAGAQSRAFTGLYGAQGPGQAPSVGARLRQWLTGLMGREAA
jgi:CRISPR-associated protein Cas2